MKMTKSRARMGNQARVMFSSTLSSIRTKARHWSSARKLPSKLQTAFKEAGIIYVNRQETGAKGKIDAAIGELIRGMENTDTVKSFLTDAFKYRADVEKGDPRSVAALMVDNTIEPMTFGKYVIKAKGKKLAI